MVVKRTIRGTCVTIITYFVTGTVFTKKVGNYYLDGLSKSLIEGHHTRIVTAIRYFSHNL